MNDLMEILKNEGLNKQEREELLSEGRLMHESHTCGEGEQCDPSCVIIEYYYDGAILERRHKGTLRGCFWTEWEEIY